MEKEVTLTEQEHQEITNKVAKIAIDNANRLNMYDTALKYFFLTMILIVSVGLGLKLYSIYG